MGLTNSNPFKNPSCLLAEPWLCPLLFKEFISFGDLEPFNFQPTTFPNHFVPVGPCARVIP